MKSENMKQRKLYGVPMIPFGLLAGFVQEGSADHRAFGRGVCISNSKEDTRAGEDPALFL